MKAQLIFEFLVAGIIFFGIIVYAVNIMNTNVADFKNKFYLDKLNSKAVKISEILTSGSDLGLAPEWPIFSGDKIDNFIEQCNNNYEYFLGIFDLNDTSVYGFTTPHYFSILINTTSEEFVCKYPPANISKAEVERIGIYDKDNGFLKMKIWVW